MSGRVTTDDLDVLRRCWHAIAFADDVFAGPLRRSVLGAELVLWSGPDGPVVALDRCPHRSAQLSAGCVVDGDIQCAYHGWRFAPSGAVSHIPQLLPGIPLPPAARLETLPTLVVDGLVHVLLEAPALTPPPVPRVPEGARWIRMADEVWECSALRVVENGLDPAHVDFVHAATFGGAGSPTDHRPKVERTEGGFVLRSEMEIKNPAGLANLTRSIDAIVTRRIMTEYVPPLSRVFTLDYGNGVVQSIFQTATPITAGTCRMLQWCWRNDTEADVSAAEVVAWDQRVLDEDRYMLERTADAFELDPSLVVSVACDRPTVEMRRVLQRLVRQGSGSTS